MEVKLLAISYQRLKETMTDIYNASGNAMGEAKVDVLASLRLRVCMNIPCLSPPPPPPPQRLGWLKFTAAAISTTQVYRFRSTRWQKTSSNFPLNFYSDFKELLWLWVIYGFINNVIWIKWRVCEKRVLRIILLAPKKQYRRIQTLELRILHTSSLPQQNTTWPIFRHNFLVGEVVQCAGCSSVFGRLSEAYLYGQNM
jgi:hypothetical protein